MALKAKRPSENERRLIRMEEKKSQFLQLMEVMIQCVRLQFLLKFNRTLMLYAVHNRNCIYQAFKV